MLNKRPSLLKYLCISVGMTGAMLLQAELPREPAGDSWRVSLPGWNYVFPRDHGSHPDFKTEWWYFTGNLKSDSGREFGYQLTFFRQGVRPPSERPVAASRFVVDHVQFVHFAISDISRGRFFFDQDLTRGAFGEAGFSDGERLAWIGRCSLVLLPGGGFRIVGVSSELSLDLELHSAKPVVFHGAEGVSQKAAGPGRASHYYSFTRLLSKGSLSVEGEKFTVTGTSWYDHEWATNQLTADQVGWDWFSLQFDDGSELMLFQIRTNDGGRDSFSGGTYVRADGSSVAVRNEEFVLTPGRTWRSKSTKATYPVEWNLKIVKLDLNIDIAARLDTQELVLAPISYWEGSIRAVGKHSGKPVSGLGYLEMTGYAGPIVGMQAAVE